MGKYANCHIKEISVKAKQFPERQVKDHIDVTFYPRYTVVPSKGAPCNTECWDCLYKDEEIEDFEDGD